MKIRQNKQKVMIVVASLLLGVAAVLAACPTCGEEDVIATSYETGIRYDCSDVPGCVGDGAITECKYYDPPSYTQIVCSEQGRPLNFQSVPFNQCYQHSILLCPQG
jgi:predicted RNA-binding Zn-ribbon protein involved in translation (DUF1610 family)